MAKTLEPFLDAGEAARLLSVCRRTVLRRIAEGAIFPAYDLRKANGRGGRPARPGGRGGKRPKRTPNDDRADIRIPLSALTRYLERCRIGPVEVKP